MLIFSCQVPYGFHTDLGQSPARTSNNHLLLQSIPGTFKTSITKLQHCKWFLYRPYLRNCYPVSLARDTWLIRSQMARKLIFLRREEKGRKIVGVTLRSTNHSPRTNPGSNPGHSTGRRGSWPLPSEWINRHFPPCKWNNTKDHNCSRLTSVGVSIFRAPSKFRLRTFFSYE